MEDKVTAINNVQYSLKEKVPNIHKNPSKNRNL